MEVTYTLARLARRLRRIVRRRAFERDLDEELRFHLDMATSHHVAHGMHGADARALTRKEFGSMHRFKDEVRDAHGITLADDLGRDLRFALRTLRRTPGFTLIALLTFALGIGANTAIFSVVNAVLLRPLPYAEPSRLVRLFETMKDRPQQPGSVNYQNYLDWRRQATSFDGIGVYNETFALLDGDGEPERVREAAVAANVLPMLGVRPLLGRVFVPGEDEKGKQHVVVLSEPFWRRRYAADRNIVGRAISIEGTPYTVVGVMPAGFNFPAGPRTMDLWAPFVPPDIAADPNVRGWHWLSVVARLKPGVSVERASQEMEQITDRLRRAYPQSLSNRGAMAMSMQEALVGDVRPILLVLLGAVFLVLLIACANVANLLLARNAVRQKDVAVRVALGASRGQITRQFLTESVVLALLGAILGLGVARLALHTVSLVGTSMLPISGPIPLDARVLAMLLGVSVLCGVAFGIAPAVQLSPSRLRAGLADLTVKTTAGSEMKRFRSGLVVAQIALSLMLLVGAGLLMRGFVALQSTDPGVVTDHLLTARIAIPRHDQRDHTERSRILRPLLERVRAIPGVRLAGLSSLLPIQESGLSASMWVDRKAWPASGTEPLIEVRSVSPGFLPAMGIRLKAGRDFTEADDSTNGIRKAIVNEALVRRLLPGENPIGRHLLQGGEQQHLDFEIIGVATDVKQSGLDQPPAPEVYTSYADPRIDWTGGDMSLAVRTTVPELGIVAEVRRALADVARDAALTNVRSMTEVVDESLADRRLTLTLFAVFAGVALVLAASGLYGVIYYLVAQRTREIGIRVALGADKRRVIRLVLGQSAVLVIAGIAAGLVAALALSRFLAGMVYGVGTHDPVTFLAVPLVLAVVALLASMVPAWKAARVDPVIALRSE